MFADGTRIYWLLFASIVQFLWYPKAFSCHDKVCKTELIMKRVADWQLAQPLRDVPDFWTNGALYTGIIALYSISGDEKYLNAMLKMGEGNEWRPGSRRFADDHVVAQTYLDLYQIKQDARMLLPTQTTFDRMMMSPQPGRKEWWWCDALFMAPPTLARLYYATGQIKYLDYMDEMFWDVKNFLYDPSENLFFRDENYFEKREKNGKKMFWSRGNGWVLAGIARILPFMPEDYPSRGKYIVLFREMANRIAQLQQPDGFWRPSLLDPASYLGGESSGTGFYTFALAWGMNQGILERKIFEPVVMKGWRALEGAVDDNGKLGWVQPVGENPVNTKSTDTDVYGVGAFLLAGSEIYRFLMSPQ